MPFRYSLKWNQTCKGGHSSDVPLHSVQWINMLMSYAFTLTILLIVVCYPSIFNVPSILILVIIHRPHRKQLAIQLLNPMIMQWVTINKRKRMVEPRTWHQRHNSTTTTTRHGVSKGLANQPPKEPMGRTGGGGSQPTDVSTEYDIAYTLHGHSITVSRLEAEQLTHQGLNGSDISGRLIDSLSRSD